MAIYDDSKTFIVDKKLEAVVKEIKEILKMERPYGQIYRLPDLNKKFEDLYLDKLEETAKPIYQAIMDARTRVIDEVQGKMCESALRPSFVRRFDELQKKAESSNNIANLQSINVEVDALKTRCLQEIVDNEPKPVPPDDGGDNPPEPPKVVKAKKVYSMKFINASTNWQLETVEDVDKRLQELRTKLISKLEENTVVHIEF